MSDRFTTFRSTFNALKALPAEYMKQAYIMIGEYAMDGVVPVPEETVAYALFCSVKPLVDTSIKKSEAGRTGGKAEANGSNPEANGSKQQANVSNPEAKKKEESRKLKGKTDSSSAYAEDSTHRRVVEAWNQLEPLGITPVRAIAENTKRHQLLVARIRQYGLEDIFDTINIVKECNFLHGATWFNFDWFLKPNNYQKIREGSYRDRSGQNHTDRMAWVDSWAGGEAYDQR